MSFFFVPVDEQLPLKGDALPKDVITVDHKIYHVVHFEVDGKHCLVYGETDGSVNARATRLSGAIIKGNAVLMVYAKAAIEEVQEMFDNDGVYPLPEDDDPARAGAAEPL